MATRRDLSDAAAATAPNEAARRLAAAPDLAGKVGACCRFAGYMPIRTEFDPYPIVDYCRRLGLAGSLPMVDREAGGDMEFHDWRPDTELAQGGFGVPEPCPATPAVIPDLVFVPLLAVDRRGWRVGYGKGYYDRALKRLRRGPEGGEAVLAVGLCFAGQLVDAVPHDDADERLDWIVTEAEIIEVKERMK